jgi:hypothetical protein
MRKLYKFGLILGMAFVLMASLISLLASFILINRIFIKIIILIGILGLILLLFSGQKYGELTVRKESDFFILRKFGWGTAINPNTKVSKILIFVMIGGLLIFMVIFFFIPVSSYNIK